jgi:GTP cyclohydrolase I
MSKVSPILIRNGHGMKAKKRVEKLLRQLLIEIGESAYREGLVDTPARMTETYGELFSGYKMNSELDLTFTEAADAIIAKNKCYQRSINTNRFKTTLPCVNT